MKNKLQNKNLVIGTWCEIPSPYLSNVLAGTGLDFVIIDMEHSVMDFKVAQEMVFAASTISCSVLIRVASLSEAELLRALDTGAAGIIVPQVNSAVQAKEIVRFCKYAPLGEKGFNPYVTSGGYRPVDASFLKEYNNQSILGIIIESVQAFENIEEIMKVDGIDIVYVGQYDLSVSLGFPGDVENPAIMEKICQTVQLANINGKAVGCMVHSPEQALKIARLGVKVLVYKADTGIIYNAYNSFCREVTGFEII